MLHWQRKSVRNRHLLWLKLAALSLSGHLVALFMIFFVYRETALDMILTVRSAGMNNNIDVVWVKEILPPTKKPVQKKVTTVAKPSRKPAPKKTTVIKKEALPKKQPKKVVKKPVPQKKVSSSAPQKKQAAQQPKKIVKKQRTVPKAKQQQQQRVAQHVDAESNEPIHVIGSYKELHALQKHQALQQEIARCWKPPIGVNDAVTCNIQVLIDWQGTVKDMQMIKGSGILMYDVAARNALNSMKLPSWTRGKTLTITFKP